MMRPGRHFTYGLLALGICGLFLIGIVPAQDKIETPSQKTKEAVEKFIRLPTTIGKKVGAWTEEARGKIEQAVGGKATRRQRSEPGDLAPPPRAAREPAAGRFRPDGKRDPFQPYNLKSRTTARPRESLSPLERYDLSQLRLVGIVWDIKRPRAMVEDTAGLGYIVTVGTPIGNSGGKVMAIQPNGIMIEESYKDVTGAKKKRDVSMKLSVD
jgi:Tfp pilus assembly protein PilP